MMLLPILLFVPFMAALGCLLVPWRVWWERLNLLACAAVGVLSCLLGRQVLASKDAPITGLGGLLRADALSAVAVGLTGFVGFVCAIYAVGYFRRDLQEGRINEKQLKLYYVLTPLCIGAMLLALLADSLGLMWVAMESATLASVLLVTFYNRKTSFEAGWKYIILGSVGISLALLGTVLTYSSAVKALPEGAAGGMNWSVLIGIANQFDPKAMRLAFALVLLGYGTKAGLAPMHTWKPDAYAEAPIPAATLLGAGLINCAIYSIMRYDALAERCLGHAFPSALLIGFGVFTILLAAPFVLVQRNYRRLLAYSSVEHAGIMTAALGFGGKLGVLGAVLHMVFHATAKPLMFFCAGNVQQHFDTAYTHKVQGVLRTLPWTGALFLLAACAVTGTPPFSLFQSEFTALSGALAAGHPWAAGLFTLGVVVIFCGFLAHMVRMNLGVATEPGRAGECPWKLSAMLLVAAATVLFGFWMPGPLFELVQDSVKIITGTP
jgi:hydrogenase-4 component F